MAIRRGLRTWPKGARWPTEVRLSENTDKGENAYQTTKHDKAAQEASRKLAETQESELAGQTSRQDTTDSREIPQGQPDLANVVCNGEFLIASRNTN